MSYCRSTLLVGFSLGFVFSLAFAQVSRDAPSNPQLASPEIEQKVDTLLKQMTFDEKIGQLVQYSATEAHPAKLSGHHHRRSQCQPSRSWRNRQLRPRAKG